MLADVMENDQAAWTHQAGIHFKIGLHAFVGMVAVNEKKIHLAVARQSAFQSREHFGFVGITAQQMQLLASKRKPLVNPRHPIGIAATVHSARQVEADNGGCRIGLPTSQEEGSTMCGADFNDGFWRTFANQFSKFDDFRPPLRRVQQTARRVETKIPQFLRRRIAWQPQKEKARAAGELVNVNADLIKQRAEAFAAKRSECDFKFVDLDEKDSALFHLGHSQL